MLHHLLSQARLWHFFVGVVSCVHLARHPSVGPSCRKAVVEQDVADVAVVAVANAMAAVEVVLAVPRSLLVPVVLNLATTSR